MQERMTADRYRVIDLFLFMCILAVFEFLIAKAAVSWFPDEAWTVTAVCGITAIVMVRWGPWCLIHAALGGVVTAAVSGGNTNQILTYAIGNMAAIAVMPLVRKWGWKRLKSETGPCFLFSALTVLAMQAGRAAVSLILGGKPDGIWLFVTTDALTYVFTILIVWVASRQDGMLEDQKHYLKRLNRGQNQ